MYKIYLALGHKELEAYLKSKEKDINLIAKKLGTIKDNIKFEGNTSYKEGVLNGLKDVRPNLLIITEKLSGTISITDLIYQIRLEHPTLRIVFLAVDRVPGDAFLSMLVTYNIYDIIVGKEINANEILNRIVSPNTFVNVAHLVPKINIDEKTGKKLYEAPSIVPVVNNIKVEGVKEPEAQPKRRIEDKIKEKDSILNTYIPIPNEKANDKIIDSSNNEKKRDKLEKKNRFNNKKEDLDDEILINDDDEIILENVDDKIVIDDTSSSENNDEEIIIDDLDEEISLENDTLNDNVEIFSKVTDDRTDLDNKSENNKNSILPLPNHNEGKLVSKDKEEVEEPLLNIKSTKKPLKVSHKINSSSKSQDDDDNEVSYQHQDRRVIKTPTPSEKERVGLFGKILGSKKDINKKVGQRIITFIGGSYGAGTSQLAFNTALELAKEDYKVMYMDLNQLRSSIESIFQLGYSDVGIDTALRGIEENDFELVDKSIITIDKILYIEENNPSPLYKTYSKLPKNLDYLFFSQDHIKKVLMNEPLDINTNMLKDLNMYLLMQEGYDFIILDAPSNMGDKLTEIATVFSMKLFFVITQDISVITNNINHQLKLLDEKRINYREKCYYILNKTENTNWNYTKVYKWLVESTQIEGLDMINVPYIQRDFIMANYEGVPISWLSNSKDLKKAFSEIIGLILS